jgi:hypothetical protein
MRHKLAGQARRASCPLDCVLQILYLFFNEGYKASSGEASSGMNFIMGSNRRRAFSNLSFPQKECRSPGAR